MRVREPILASCSVPSSDRRRELPFTAFVVGGLHWIPSNHAPYFSLCVTADDRADCPQGAAHKWIAEKFADRFDDLAALHLSDIDGVPMHAEANGWYWLAGFYGGAGEKFHGGNSKGHYGGEYRNPTPAECLAVFARHCRVPIEQAEHMAHVISADRIAWSGAIRGMRPRWRAEAEACIAKHGLLVFGDEGRQTPAEWLRLHRAH